MTDGVARELVRLLEGKKIETVKVWPEIIELRLVSGPIVEIMWVPEEDGKFVVRTRW